MPPESQNVLSKPNTNVTKPNQLSQWLHEHGMISVYVAKQSTDWVIRDHEGLLQPWEESVFFIPHLKQLEFYRDKALRVASRRFGVTQWGSFISPRHSYFPASSITIAIKLGLPKEQFHIPQRKKLIFG